LEQKTHKDLALLASENDLFTHDKLDQLYWLSTSSVDNDLRLSFFNYYTTTYFYTERVVTRRPFSLTSAKISVLCWNYRSVQNSNFTYLLDTAEVLDAKLK
jgi:hypothetical protein